MFLYHQKDKNSKWECSFDSDALRKELVDAQVPMVSILTTKDPIETDEQAYTTPYKGPLYIDIDSSNIGEAIVAAVRFNGLLLKNGVQYYDIYLSGKKGFHFIIPMETFCPARPIKNLPLIYKEMALDLFVEGIDMKVYNQGKPRLLRTANVKRADNGKYKVSITQLELETLTKEKYAELTESPRPILATTKSEKANKLVTLYEVCKARVVRKLKAESTIEYSTNEEIVATLGENGELPECINKLIAEGDTVEGSNFNSASMVFANFMLVAGIKGWKTYATTMAENVKSSSYNTKASRYKELVKMTNYFSGKPKFSKGYLFSVITPCGDCKLCKSKALSDGELGESEGEVDEDYYGTDLRQDRFGYLTGEGKAEKRITNFTLDLISKFIEPIEDEEFGETRSGVQAWVLRKGKKTQKVLIDENSWMSAKDFKKTFKGKSNLIFTGNDSDVQKIGGQVMAEADNLLEVCAVSSVGMHRHKVDGRTIFVYVEPSFSVSSLKEKGTHEIWGNIPAPPNIKDAKYPEPTKELKKFIDNMFESNSKEVTASVVSWMAVCHVKVQLTMKSNQFPILNLWGNAGGGKSTVSALFAGLHGLDYMLEHSPISLQGTTPWAVANYCTTSESTPRLIEEFNMGEIPPSKYDMFTGLLKAAWNRQTFAKGGITSTRGAATSASVIEAKISAPILVMSEQAPERPALRQRMIQLNVSLKGREGKEEAMYYLHDHQENFYNLARAMVWQSLVTHPDTIKKYMEEASKKVPREIDARPRYAYQTLLTGARFFCDTLKVIGLDEDYVHKTFKFMETSILNNLIGSVQKIKQEKLTTEIVLVLEEMSVQAKSALSVMPPQWTLSAGVDYVLDSRYFYLDLKLAHSKYLRWARQGGTRIILTSATQFSTLLKQEEFFLGMVSHTGLGEGNTLCAKLDADMLADRGISMDMFECDDDD